MSLDGSISASALFHDKNGTATLKVVSLESVEAYVNGKVAIITGTCNSSGVTIDLTNTGYVAADGTTVSWANDTQIRRIAFAASPAANLTGNGFLKDLKLGSSQNAVAVTGIPVGNAAMSGTPEYLLTANADGVGATATFTVVIHGA